MAALISMAFVFIASSIQGPSPLVDSSFASVPNISKDSQNEISEFDLPNRITQQASKAIASIEGNFIYLNPDRLIVTDHGISLLSDNESESIPLPVLFSGIRGPYIHANPSVDILGRWYCHNCQRWNSRFVDVCQYCHTPRGE